MTRARMTPSPPLPASLPRLAACAALALSIAGCRPGPWAPRPEPGTPMTAVDQPVAAPYSSVCRLEVHRRLVKGLVVTENTSVSTAALVDPGHLLTVAHNFSGPPSTPVTRRTFECGVRGNQVLWARRDRFRREDLRSVPDFEGELVHDYAVMGVGRGAPFGSGFRFPRPGEAAIRPGDTVHVAGYALDRSGFDGRTLYHGTGRVRGTSRDSAAFVYDVDTRGGMSGAPIWVVRRDAEGRPEYVIVGVHVGRQAIDRRLWAVARRIGGDALRNVHAWVAADSAAATP